MFAKKTPFIFTTRSTCSNFATLAFCAILVSACGGGGGGNSGNGGTAAQLPADPATSAPYRAPFEIVGSAQDARLLPAVSRDTLANPLPASSEIDSALQKALHDGNIPGAAVAVLVDGKAVYAKSYGYANLEQRSVLRPEQRFVLGSLSKQFVASAVMMLVEAGKIELDAKASRYLGTVPAAWSEITIRQLLTHTAGLTQQPPDSFTFYQLDAFGSKSEDEKLAILESFPLAQAPGKGYLYSNLGYDALGFVIAKVSGKPYFDFMQERIFTPLGMSSARLLKPGSAGVGADAVQGYLAKADGLYAVKLTDGAWNGFALASSGLEMNVLDMAKWDAALDGTQLLKQSSKDLMWSKQVATDVAGQSYGFGWGLQTVDGLRQIFHTGTVAAFTTDYRRYPDAHVSIIVFTNKSDNPASLGIATAIARILQAHRGV